MKYGRRYSHLAGAVKSRGKFRLADLPRDARVVIVDGALKADVIRVSDGISDVSSEARAEWTRRRTGRGMRAYGVLIGANQGLAQRVQFNRGEWPVEDRSSPRAALEC